MKSLPNLFHTSIAVCSVLMVTQIHAAEPIDYARLIQGKWNCTINQTLQMGEGNQLEVSGQFVDVYKGNRVNNIGDLNMGLKLAEDTGNGVLKSKSASRFSIDENGLLSLVPLTEKISLVAVSSNELGEFFKERLYPDLLKESKDRIKTKEVTTIQIQSIDEHAVQMLVIDKELPPEMSPHYACTR